MKQLVYGGILMITGMLGVIAAILALSASIADDASIMFLICLFYKSPGPGEGLLLRMPVFS